MAVPFFDFGDVKRWLQWIKVLRATAREEGIGDTFQECDDRQKQMSGNDRLDRTGRFWYLLREFWPEDYRKIASDAMLHGLIVPGLEKAPHPMAIQQAEAEGPDEPAEDGEAPAPVAFRAKKDAPLDFSRWEGKKRDQNAGWDWVYDNIGNMDVDPYTAPNAGDPAYLKDIRANPALRQKFLSDYVTRSMARNSDADEKRNRVMDTAEDLADIYSDIQNRRNDAPKEVQNQIVGYVKTVEMAHV